MRDFFNPTVFGWMDTYIQQVFLWMAFLIFFWNGFVYGHYHFGSSCAESYPINIYRLDL